MRTKKVLLNISKTFLLPAAMFGLSVGGAMAEPSDMSHQTQGSHDEKNAKMHDRMDERQKDQIDAAATLRKSTELYEAIVKGPHGQVPDGVLVKTQCVVVLPDVMTGAILVGGTHGVGITSCRENNVWSVPAFVRLNAVSFGAQLGGKSSDIVMFILTDKGKAALKRGNFSLGAEASIVAGTFDKSFDVSSHGAVAYIRTEGAFAGASLSGGTLASDDTNTAAFYGKDVNYVSLLDGHVATKQNDHIDKLISLLPR